MTERIKTGGGRFDPAEENVYFLASNVERMKWGAEVYDHILTAVNELNGKTEIDTMRSWLDDGKAVFLDSGIFNLAMNHVRAHGISHNEALNLPPDEVDGFADLFERYVGIVREYGDQLWGYIELDLGGRDNKMKTRATLEGMGLRPIPVYHPLADGWEYFDYLAERYDRICMGNIVQAERPDRLRLLATLYERKQKYPHLWVHVLGLTPNEVTYAYPPNSADSSTWLSAVRWNGYTERTCGTTLGHLPKDFQYVLKSDPTSEIGSRKAVKMAAYASGMGMMNWRNHINNWQAEELEEQP